MPIIYTPQCGHGEGGVKGGILTGVITNCRATAMAAAKVEENFMMRDQMQVGKKCNELNEYEDREGIYVSKSKGSPYFRLV